MINAEEKQKTMELTDDRFTKWNGFSVFFCIVDLHFCYQLFNAKFLEILVREVDCQLLQRVVLKTLCKY